MTIAIDKPETKKKASKNAKKRPEADTSALKAFRVLDVFSGKFESLGVADIARRAELPASTTHRLLAQLLQAGFVERDDVRYQLGKRLFSLGNQVNYCKPHGLREQIAPYIAELFSATGLTVKVGVLEGAEVLILDQVSGLSAHSTGISTGSRIPAIPSSLGKVLIAFDAHRRTDDQLREDNQSLEKFLNEKPLIQKQLLEIRTKRISYGAEHSTTGQVSIAAPVLLHGTAVAAISLTSSPNDPRLSRSIDALLHTTETISRTLKL